MDAKPDSPRVGVAYAGSGPRLVARAEALAEELGLPITGDPAAGPERFDLLLTVTQHRLTLRETDAARSAPLYVDFLGGATGYRRRSARSGRQPLAAAIGPPSTSRTVVDATAGLARDAFLLACLGYTVTAVERSAVLGALVRDGLSRAADDADAALRSVLERMTFMVADARDVLRSRESVDPPDVVFVDPMYPPRGKAALGKKEMRVCRRLVGDDRDAGELLEIARAVARKRVVVKRHRHAPALAPGAIAHPGGKLVRFDIYPSVGRSAANAASTGA